MLGSSRSSQLLVLSGGRENSQGKILDLKP